MTSPSFGEALRDWRRRRRLSQLDLAMIAGISGRHLAFLETGRSRPTRGMALRLGEALDMPRHDRNALLEAAGFAAAYRARALDDGEMSWAREAIGWMLERHDPYPALALDRHWRLLGLNRTAAALLGQVGIGRGDSLLEAFVGSGALRGAIENWDEVAHHLSTRLATESRHLGGDSILEAAARTLTGGTGLQNGADGPLPAMVATRFRAGPDVLSFFSTIAQFGTAEDIALADLKIELMFPADGDTRAALMALGDKPC
jgi:transcriptional regulator with XRE-family HTH domain